MGVATGALYCKLQSLFWLQGVLAWRNSLVYCKMACTTRTCSLAACVLLVRSVPSASEMAAIGVLRAAGSELAMHSSGLYQPWQVLKPAKLQA